MSNKKEHNTFTEQKGIENKTKATKTWHNTSSLPYYLWLKWNMDSNKSSENSVIAYLALWESQNPYTGYVILGAYELPKEHETARSKLFAD